MVWSLIHSPCFTVFRRGEFESLSPPTMTVFLSLFFLVIFLVFFPCTDTPFDLVSSCPTFFFFKKKKVGPQAVLRARFW